MDKISVLLILLLWLLVYIQETDEKLQFKFAEDIQKIRSQVYQQRQKQRIAIDVDYSASVSYSTRKKLRGLAEERSFNNIFQMNSSTQLQIDDSNIQAIDYLISNATESHFDTIHIVSILYETSTTRSTLQEKIYLDIMQPIFRKIYNIPEFSFQVRLVPLLKTRYNQNIFNKFQNQEYSQQIMEELIKSKQMSQCQFTYKKCKNYLILQMRSLKNEYLQYQGVYLIPQLSESYVKQILFQILDILPLKLLSKNVSQQQLSKIWYQFQYLKFLQSIQNQLLYLQYISQMKGTYIHDLRQANALRIWQTYLKSTIKCYTQGNNQKIWQTGSFDILDNDKVGRIDLFPNDYKIGVLIPILVLVFYPSIMILKKIKNII